MTRLGRVLAILLQENIDGVIITDPVNIRYLSGFTGSFGVLWISKDLQLLLTDSRYGGQAAKESALFDRKILPNHEVYSTLKELLTKTNVGKIGIENQTLTVNEYDWLQCQMQAYEFVYLDDAIDRLRQIKEPEELSCIRIAASITDAAFEHIVSWMKVGHTEIEVALELEVFMRQHGAECLSFPIIVASGLRSSLPHGTATDKPIELGDLVTLDFGCKVKGYTSDMTRTITMGAASQQQKELYDLVLTSQTKALDTLKSGVACHLVDQMARNVITEAGYGPFFDHGLGHSLGLKVHEQPRLSRTSYDNLKANMVLTIEPGIYIPDFGGIRIEDMVRITEDGFERLTQSETRLFELI